VMGMGMGMGVCAGAGVCVCVCVCAGAGAGAGAGVGAHACARCASRAARRLVGACERRRASAPNVLSCAQSQDPRWRATLLPA